MKKENLLILWETITLSSDRAKVIIFSFGPLFLALYPTERLGQPGRICTLKNIIFPLILGQKYNCPGCGITHAISRVMHADLLSAYNYNKLIVIVFPLIIFNLYRWVKSKPA
jgi:hypothetical protein